MIGRTLRHLRWWWWAGFIWLGLSIGLVVRILTDPVLRSDLVGPSATPTLTMLSPMLAGLIWLVVLAPMLDARSRAFSDRRPPISRARMVVIFTWIPTVIFGLLAAQAAIVKLVGIEDFGWYDHGYVWWAVGACVLAVVYGRMMSAKLVHRIRTEAWRSRRCFRCNYDLTGLSSDRCPECGEPTGAENLL